MPWTYKKVLVIGATSGIGEALAARVVTAGSSVIVTGRRKEKLEGFVHKHGKDKSSAVPLDVTNIDEIPSFAINVIETHPDLDCVILNAGIQRRVDFSKPETVDLSSIQNEFNTNYISYIALTTAFLPFLQTKEEESALIFMSSVLALVPITRCPNYCASKAALHHTVLVLREQLKDSKVKIVEIFPSAVQTELHDEKNQPDIKDGHKLGMPLDAFTEEAFFGLEQGHEHIAVGPAKQSWDALELPRQKMFEGTIELMKNWNLNH
ncbi:hypothetical protein MMC29_004465 [Sticta canariensis]|nr:hypothetical protein [Sticta canariensis]